jgi:hypothetical protein
MMTYGAQSRDGTCNADTLMHKTKTFPPSLAAFHFLSTPLTGHASASRVASIIKIIIILPLRIALISVSIETERQ